MESKPNVTACFIDIMGVIQGLQHIPETFGRLAKKLLSSFRDRSTGGENKIGKQKTPRQWRKFLSNGHNKCSLHRFLQGQWSEDRYAQKLQGKQLHVTNKESCYRISATDHTSVVCENAPCLTSRHDKADTNPTTLKNH